jgi:hypothetical protein
MTRTLSCIFSQQLCLLFTHITRFASKKFFCLNSSGIQISTFTTVVGKLVQICIIFRSKTGNTLTDSAEKTS